MIEKHSIRASWGQGACAIALTAALGAHTACNTSQAQELPNTSDNQSALQTTAAHSTWGNASALETAFHSWKQAHERNGGNRNIVLSLGWSKGLSKEQTQARGIATLDLESKRVVVDIEAADTKLGDVWLIDNQPGEGRSVMPERGDRMIRLGQLDGDGKAMRLEASLSDKDMDGFAVDLVVVTPAGGSPETDSVLFGQPNLFQRMAMGIVDGATISTAAAPSGDVGNFSALVALGEDLFLNGTFEGNGRTCGTCHPPQNNFTIDPAFIAKLPRRDPLFVAEFVPALAENFENPVLMRKFGLIVENVDGLDDLENKFTMRSVPHTFAQGVSITPSTIDGSTTPPFERTGWSGDGAPGGGTLREFSIGAVTQHAPKTLGRVAGVDFRLPTDEELDAMEAFMLSLGRQQDFDLSAMTFLDANVAEGVAIFNDAAVGKCAGCHFNAGANIGFGPGAGIENANFDTGVENAPHPADALNELRPRDGGFGTEANAEGGFGNGGFNTSSLVEAADTPPFFHNNLVNTIEEAVAFYNSDAFNNSPSGLAVGGIALTDEQVVKVAAFLRVINSVDNIDRAIEALERVRAGEIPSDRSSVCISDVDDTIQVLKDGRLHKDAAFRLFAARFNCTLVIDVLFEGESEEGELAELVDLALLDLRRAQDLMVSR